MASFLTKTLSVLNFAVQTGIALVDLAVSIGQWWKQHQLLRHGKS
jgi:hypothetical protein